jgi:hypothetical protein
MNWGEASCFGVVMDLIEVRDAVVVDLWGRGAAVRWFCCEIAD